MSVEDICVNYLRNSLLPKIGSAWEIENEETNLMRETIEETIVVLNNNIKYMNKENFEAFIIEIC